MNSKIVVITGASRGLGEEFAKLICSEGHSVVLTARSESGLKRVKDEIHQLHPKSKVYTFTSDLTSEVERLSFINWLEDQKLVPDDWINNAGFGSFGAFTDEEFSRYSDMMKLNCEALVHLSHYFLSIRKPLKSGGLLNVASIAGFQPNSNMAVYGATKAFVVNFSEALSMELDGTGVTCSVLCPGLTKTNFFDSLKMEKTRVTQMGYADPKIVVRHGWQALKKGSRVKVSGQSNYLLSCLTSPSVLPFYVKKKVIGYLMSNK